MRVRATIPVVFFGVTLAGCASAGFRQVSFAGETSTAGSSPANGRTVHVVQNGQMKDSALEMRIRYRLEEFLLSRGYTLAGADTADLYVLATFGAGERMVASIAPVHRDAEVKEERDADGRVIRRTYVPERTDYLRVPLVKNSIWLQVLSSDARHYRQTGQVRNLWRGEASMIAQSATIENFAPFLMVAALKYFGRGTSDIVTVDVRDRDAVWTKQ